jgi:uncharacterized protein
MELFPPLNQQLMWIAFLSVLSFFAFKIIKSKKLVHLDNRTVAFISLKDVLYTFGFYVVLSFAVVPFVFSIVHDHYIQNPIQTISLFQLFFMTLVSSFILCYLKIRKISLIKSPESYIDGFVKVILYLIVIFPIVSLLGQICDTFLYLFFDVKGYEQLAVTFLKKTLHDPLSLTASLISIVVLAPLTEELLFRGVLLNFIQNRFGSWAAVIVSGVLFAIFHYSHSQGFGNVSLIVALSFFGMMLGIFYLMTASLFYPIMLHAIFNALSSLRILFFDT